MKAWAFATTVFLAAGVFPGMAVAGCPEGSFQIGEAKIRIENDKRIIERQCVESLVIDPAFFVMDWERPFLEARIAELKAKQQRYQDQLVLLQRWYGDQDVNAREVDQLRRDIYFENAADAISMLSAIAKLLQAADYLSPDTGRQVSDLLSAVQGDVHVAAMAVQDADVEKQKSEAAEAVLSLKQLIAVPGVPADKQEAMKKIIDVTYKILKIPSRHLKESKDQEMWNDLIRDLDDIIGVAGVFIPTLKAERAAGHIIAGQYALWQLHKNRLAVNDAFFNLGKARVYYQKRLHENDDTLQFYENRLQSIVKTGR